MKTYIGTKQIEATPLNLGDYNKLKGWNIPENENPLTEGYLIKYNDNYISWSPKEVFEESYKELKAAIITNLKSELPHQQRVIDEALDLDNKVELLNRFIRYSDIFKTLDINEQTRLKFQLLTMYNYRAILVERIDNF